MNSTTVNNILDLRIFAAGDTSGFPVSTMLLESADLRKISRVDLLAALSGMEQDGLLRCEEQAYYSTTLGKIALRKLLVEQGRVAQTLVDQKRYALADLILAISAHDQVENGIQIGLLTREMMAVYLHEFDSKEVVAAIDDLIKTAHLRRYEFGYRNGIIISGEGLQYYQQEVCQRLNLDPEQGILSLVTLPDLDGRFVRLGLDPVLLPNLQQRWWEMETCASSGVYLAAVILIGSVLEGVLLGRLQQRITDAMTSPKAPRERGSTTVKRLEDWTLQDYISVSADIGLIPKSVEKHVHELRDTRNLVHPNKQVTSGITADQPLYRISRQVAETVIDGLVLP
ncbi:hypothetical protein [Herminiimonas contaminans]|uniref:Uncharacterized protein n=1 Tax=Herminiimonas contaminans TaxID=1111140 RepID=A0ABS0EXB9_9BURK|nr:hypothetical protein [Herminiimonas contaminans]MBF8179486.1 hypothetical protein [Herminiimonas contaminans]